MEGYLATARLLPPSLRGAAEALAEGDKRRCEELCLRRGRPMTARLGAVETPLTSPAVTEADLRFVLQEATRSSLHAATEQLSRGFLSAPGGVRVGVCGTAAGADGLRAFSSLSLRVPRAVKGCSDAIWPRLVEAGYPSLLILSPPGGGKTTLLRDLARRYSESGLRVSVADERGEIADAYSGTPHFDVGPFTDVMTGIPKARAALMLLRAMGPEVMAFDEITDEEDAAALLQATGSGVRLLATLHGTEIAGALARPACRRLLENGAFSRYVIIEANGGVRRYRLEGASCIFSERGC